MKGHNTLLSIVVICSLLTPVLVPLQQVRAASPSPVLNYGILLSGNDSELMPVVDCVLPTENGFIALFGVKNGHDTPLTFEVGPDNRFDPEPIDRGQPVEFIVGHQHNIVSVEFDQNTTISWILNGRKATASEESKHCPSPTDTPTPVPSVTPSVVPTTPVPSVTPSVVPTTPVPSVTPSEILNPQEKETCTISENGLDPQSIENLSPGCLQEDPTPSAEDPKDVQAMTTFVIVFLILFVTILAIVILAQDYDN